MIFNIIGTEQTTNKDIKKKAIIILLIVAITAVSVISVIAYTNNQSNDTNRDDSDDNYGGGDTDTDQESPG